MTVYVDDFGCPATAGTFTGRWCHLTADTREELHSFAALLGLRRAWFQDPVVNGKPTPAKPGSRAAEKWHYDVTWAKRLKAIRLGAVAISYRDLPGIIDRRVAAGAARGDEGSHGCPASGS